MAYSNNGVSIGKTDRFGTHYTAWCKEKTDKNGKPYIEGYLFFGNKGMKLVRYSGREGVNRKGAKVFPIDVTIFKVDKSSPMTI